ncbi:MAG: hypothetical protein KIS66_16685 [Fimbriimonadaceae bacterium]|nr:hypothetical protein [Fimbriimonadaceae bacterium]
MSQATDRAQSLISEAMKRTTVLIDLGTLNELLAELAEARRFGDSAILRLAERAGPDHPVQVVEVVSEPTVVQAEEAATVAPMEANAPPDPAPSLLPETDPVFDREWMAKHQLDPIAIVQIVRRMVQVPGDGAREHGEALALSFEKCLAVSRRYGPNVVKRLREVERACERDAAYADLLGRLKAAVGKR